MRLRKLIPAVIAVWLVLGATEAAADHYGFTVSPSTPNQGQPTTFQFQGPLDGVERIRWDLGDGDFDPGLDDQLEVTRTYSAPGPVTVRLRVVADDHVDNDTAVLTVNGQPSVDFGFSPASPVIGQEVAFTSTVSDPESDAVTLAWDFGDGATGTGEAPSHAYASAGTRVVTVTATDEHGAQAVSSETVTVSETPAPTASFDVSPAEPFTGEPVTFTSTSTAGAGELTALEWDLDDDGEFDDGTGTEATRSFASPGTYVVLLRATQTDGKRSVAFTELEVVDRPPPPPLVTAPSSESPGSGTPIGESGAPVVPDPLERMQPFPIVRIAGLVLPRGADITILSVRAPRGALVRARCGGRGCPVGSLTRTVGARLLRLRRFERRLRAGVTLELFVRRGRTIGKYTRFRIRAGRPPARVDRCLLPGSGRPVRCT